MKKLLILLAVCFAFIMISAFTSFNKVSSTIVQENTIPSYAKWGKMAMEKTKEKYPNAQITDYLHIGRDVGNSTSTEKFKLILKENNREFGLFVHLKFNNETEDLVDVNFSETTP